MTFGYPWMFLLLLLVPPLVVLRYWTRRRPAASFSDGEALARLPRSWAVYASRLLPLMYTAGLVLLVVAMTRPQRGLDESRVSTEAVDIVLLVDVSPSMEAIDLSDRNRIMNRLDAAKKVMKRFIESRTSDRIGMVAFAAYPYTVSPLTLDHPWLLQNMDRLSTEMLQDGSQNLTAIGSGLGYSINRLRDSEAATKIIILLTDGINNAGTLSPVNAALAAEALAIKVYTIGAGASGEVRMPLRDQNGNYVRDRFGNLRTMPSVSRIDEDTLKKVADITGTRYFRAGDFDSLEEVFEEINQLEKTEIEVEKYTRYEERFMPFLLIAMLALVTERVLSFTRIGRIP
jgi:Ca-activated chloride channel family protein